MTLRSLISSDGLKARLVRGSILTGISFIGQSGLRLVGNLVLTRILFPEAFGVMALVQVVMAGLTMFSELGLRASIIQDKRGEDPAFLNTAFVIQIVRGLLLWGMTWVLATPFAAFYEAPELAQLLPVAGLMAVFQGFNSTKMYTQNRALTLGRLTMLQLASQAVGLVVMIALALWLETVWALAVGGLMAPLFLAVGSHMVLPGARNRLSFEKAAAVRLFGFGKYVFLATMTGFLVQNADRAILGKITTLGDLALYTIAFFLASVPMLLIRRLVDMIVFPLYSSTPPSESAENRRKISRARWMLTAPAMVMLGVLALIGNDLIILLYDPRYEAAGPLLVLIAVAQMPVLITASYNNIPLAAGDSGWFATLTTSSAILRVIAILVGTIQFGIVGAILAPVIATVFYYPIMYFVIHRYQGRDVRHDVVALMGAVILGFTALWFNPEAWALLSI